MYTGERYYLHWSTWFDSHKYDTKFFKKIIKDSGGENIRLSNLHGQSNLPKVICFNSIGANLFKIEKALIENGLLWPVLNEKTW